MIPRVVASGRALAAQGLMKVPIRTMYPQQSSNVIAGMPRNRIPFPEKFAAGVFIGICILATPIWVVTHMDDYRTLEPK